MGFPNGSNGRICKRGAEGKGRNTFIPRPLHSCGSGIPKNFSNLRFINSPKLRDAYPRSAEFAWVTQKSRPWKILGGGTRDFEDVFTLVTAIDKEA